MIALHFGAGKIGRGFIGAVLSKAGYKLIFADVNQPLVDLINSRGAYAVHVLDTYSHEELISGVSAVNSDSQAAIDLIAQAELVTTAVSMKVLPFVASVIAKGLRRRLDAGNAEPLNIICCENGIRATSQLKTLALAHMDEELITWVEDHVAFVDSGVDRIVPPINFEDPLDVAVEDFYEWNVDGLQVKGTLPPIAGMHLTDMLDAHIERKLFTVNTGHVATAFFGNLKGYTYIFEALADEQILGLVRNVLCESGAALVAKFGLDPDVQASYAETVIGRFRNPWLKDLVSRVGHDARRKLGPTLYFSYPVAMALEAGIPTDNLCLAISAGLHVDIEGDVQNVEIREMIASLGLTRAIEEITGLKDAATISTIEEDYHMVTKLLS